MLSPVTQEKGRYWVLLQFEKPIFCPINSLLIGSRLDTDICKSLLPFVCFCKLFILGLLHPGLFPSAYPYFLAPFLSRCSFSLLLYSSRLLFSFSNTLLFTVSMFGCMKASFFFGSSYFIFLLHCSFRRFL